MLQDRWDRGGQETETAQTTMTGLCLVLLLIVFCALILDNIVQRWKMFLGPGPLGFVLVLVLCATGWARAACLALGVHKIPLF